MSEDGYLQFAAMIVAAGGIAYAFHLIWRHVMCPVYQFFKAVSLFAEAQPVLIEIAHEFRPNDGDSLRDQVDAVNIRLGNIEGQMEILVQRRVWDGETERRHDDDMQHAHVTSPYRVDEV